MEQFLAEYFVNSIWQVLLLAVGAWLLLRALRPSPKVQHWIWVAVLPLLLLAPLLSMHSSVATCVQAIALPLSPEPEFDLTPAEIPVPTQVLEHASPADIPNQSAPAPAATSSAKTWASVWSERFHLPEARELQLGPVATLWVAAFYLATIAFALIRLLVGWRAAGRLIAQATRPDLNRSESLLVEQCCRRLGVNHPKILQSSEIRSPMVVGVFHPTLLLSEGLANRSLDLNDRSGRNLEAVLLHELAHLQRRDCLANFACRIIALPVAYHPATWAVRQRIRLTQEMLCDAIAAAEMQSPIKYARCLVGLAEKIQSSDRQIAQIYGATMFDGKILEERVMQLIEIRKAPSLWTRTIRVMCGVVVAIAMMAAAATFHVTPTLAQKTSPAVATQPAATPDPASAARSGQSNSVEAPLEADSPDSAQQIAEATRKFDAAMRIVDDRLAKSFNRNTQTGQHAVVEEQKDRTRTQLQSTPTQEAAEIAERNARIAQVQAMLENPELQQRLADARAKLDSPEFKEKMKHIAEAQAKFDSPEFKKQMADMKAKFNSPEFQEKMKHIAETQAKFNSPEFKKQMADMQAKFNSPQFKQKMKELNSAEFQKRMEEMQARMNSAELQKQIANATARVNNPEFRKQLEELNRKYRDQLQQLLRQYNSDPASPLPSPAPRVHPAPPAPPSVP